MKVCFIILLGIGLLSLVTILAMLNGIKRVDEIEAQEDENDGR
jgi:hypothetical protein